MRAKSKILPMVSLRKLWQVIDILERIERYVRRMDNPNTLQVTYGHDSNLNLVSTRWSDQHYGDDSETRKKVTFEYVYEVTSKGISFRGYTEYGEWENYWRKTIRSWSFQSDDAEQMRLTEVPNRPPPPPNKITTMYLFHQEKIKEQLSMLPAWAIGVMNDY